MDNYRLMADGAVHLSSSLNGKPAPIGFPQCAGVFGVATFSLEWELLLAVGGLTPGSRASFLLLLVCGRRTVARSHVYRCLFIFKKRTALQNAPTLPKQGACYGTQLKVGLQRGPQGVPVASPFPVQ